MVIQKVHSSDQEDKMWTGVAVLKQAKSGPFARVK